MQTLGFRGRGSGTSSGLFLREDCGVPQTAPKGMELLFWNGGKSQVSISVPGPSWMASWLLLITPGKETTDCVVPRISCWISFLSLQLTKESDTSWSLRAERPTDHRADPGGGMDALSERRLQVSEWLCGHSPFIVVSLWQNI